MPEAATAAMAVMASLRFIVLSPCRVAFKCAMRRELLQAFVPALERNNITLLAARTQFFLSKEMTRRAL
jgi:hypothetical protein